MHDFLSALDLYQVAAPPCMRRYESMHLVAKTLTHPDKQPDPDPPTAEPGGILGFFRPRTFRL